MKRLSGKSSTTPREWNIMEVEKVRECDVGLIVNGMFVSEIISRHFFKQLAQYFDNCFCEANAKYELETVEFRN